MVVVMEVLVLLDLLFKQVVLQFLDSRLQEELLLLDLVF